jgi:hypothetical protein
MLVGSWAKSACAGPDHGQRFTAMAAHVTVLESSEEERLSPEEFGLCDG